MRHSVLCFAGLVICLVLPSVPAADDRHPFPLLEVEINATHTLATLSPNQARHLQGRPAIFRVVLDSEAGREGGYDHYDCQGEEPVERTVCLPADEETDDEMVVEAVLRVIHHKEWVAPSGSRWQSPCRLALSRPVLRPRLLCPTGFSHRCLPW